MPHFKVILSGSGITYPIEEVMAVGFFTTRVVRASSLEQANDIAKELVLSEWRDGGVHAVHNEGAIPSLVVDRSFPIGPIAGIFGSKRLGYSFYSRDD